VKAIESIFENDRDEFSIQEIPRQAKIVISVVGIAYINQTWRVILSF